MLIRVGKSEGLRLDPFLVAGGNGRLLMLINAPEMKTGRYGHYASGGLVEWDLELSEFLEQRHLRAGKVPFELDIASTERLGREIEGGGNENSEYSDLIPTIVDELGWHYRAHHDATKTLHNVLALHDHLCRDGQYVRHLLYVMRTLGDIEHPNVVPPKVSIFDPLAGSYLLGSEYASHGRLSDRMPDGAQLPVRWAVAMADAILAGLDAIAEHDIYLSNLPAYAIGISKEGAAQIVPSLLAHEGKPEDGPKAVAVLLYQMLTGAAPLESNSLPPALVRKAIPESVSDVVLGALDGRYSNVVTLRADLRMVQGDIREESAEAITGSAMQRTYGFLEKLTGSTLVRLEASALKCEEDGNWDGLMAVLHAIIDAL
ncbi:MAG TPA: hypothetical protein EYN66_10280 [Myxococcales bacterium]|nr:hypothetical protein [Myxococcales bacterium]